MIARRATATLLLPVWLRPSVGQVTGLSSSKKTTTVQMTSDFATQNFAHAAGTWFAASDQLTGKLLRTKATAPSLATTRQSMARTSHTHRSSVMSLRLMRFHVTSVQQTCFEGAQISLGAASLISPFICATTVSGDPALDLQGSNYVKTTEHQRAPSQYLRSVLRINLDHKHVPISTDRHQEAGVGVSQQGLACRGH
jgi:hypothetical protein